jgi:hypothetical protein
MLGVTLRRRRTRSTPIARPRPEHPAEFVHDPPLLSFSLVSLHGVWSFECTHADSPLQTLRLPTPSFQETSLKSDVTMDPLQPTEPSLVDGHMPPKVCGPAAPFRSTIKLS